MEWVNFKGDINNHGIEERGGRSRVNLKTKSKKHRIIKVRSPYRVSIEL